jgi:hypothetical protein
MWELLTSRSTLAELSLFFTGGGGTFGVVLESTILASPRVTLQTVIVSFTPALTNNTLTKELWTILADNGLKWADEGWGGYSKSGVAILINPKLTKEEAAVSMAPLIAFGQRLAAEKVQGAQLLVAELPSWMAFFNAFTKAYIAVRYHLLCLFPCPPEIRHSLGSGLKPCACVSLNPQKQLQGTCFALCTSIRAFSC